MQSNVELNLMNLQNRASQRKLSLNALKTKEDCKFENEFFEYVKDEIYKEITKGR